jgi:uncharacterized membrane protein YqhA
MEMEMARFLKASRFLILVPILGLALAAAFFFVFGGIGLLWLLVEIVLDPFHLSHIAKISKNQFIFEVVEYVHTFLIGTVLYITAVGLYQLFIEEIDFAGWLRIDSTEDLETSLIGVTVVVLAVNFMGAIIAGGTTNLLQYGAGIALPIIALGVFVGLRTWASTMVKSAGKTAGNTKEADG